MIYESALRKPMNFAEHLIWCRETRKLNHQQAARMLKIGKPTLIGLEAGMTEMRMSTFFKIAAGYRVQPHILFAALTRSRLNKA